MRFIRMIFIFFSVTFEGNFPYLLTVIVDRYTSSNKAKIFNQTPAANSLI